MSAKRPRSGGINKKTEKRKRKTKSLNTLVRRIFRNPANH
nr:MAG TPA: hypothetical protein [Caudoviricetes sp.]